MRRFLASLPMLLAVTMFVVAPQAAQAQSINAGGRAARDQVPFNIQPLAEFDTPWAINFLPDERLLLTEKGGKIIIVHQNGEKTEVSGVPEVAYSGQNGLLDIIASPDFRKSSAVYFTFSAPDRGGSRVILVRAILREKDGKAWLEDRAVIWEQTTAVKGGQPGGIIAFSPDEKHLFLSLGDRMEPATAQDDNAPMGKILRMNLDGSVPEDNPYADEEGIKALTWSKGHRNPYGLAFSADGQLWEHEMGPRGGDELNLIKPGLNYGWPLVSNGDNYSGRPIPRHTTRPEFEAPPLFWTPVIAPAGLVFYEGDMFADWKGSALIGSLSGMALIRVVMNADGQPDEVDRFELENRIRDVAVASDGAIWLIEDANPGRLLRLTPKE